MTKHKYAPLEMQQISQQQEEKAENVNISMQERKLPEIIPSTE